MKKLILILTLLTALFLAGCTGPSYEGDQCYDNDVCSVKEEKIGGCNDCIVEEVKVIANDVDTEKFYDCDNEACKYTDVCLCDVPTNYPDYSTCYVELKEKELTNEDEFYQEASQKIKELNLSFTNCEKIPQIFDGYVIKDSEKNVISWYCYNGNFQTALNYVEDTFYVCNYWRGE